MKLGEGVTMLEKFLKNFDNFKKKCKFADIKITCLKCKIMKIGSGSARAEKEKQRG